MNSLSELAGGNRRRTLSKMRSLREKGDLGKKTQVKSYRLKERGNFRYCAATPEDRGRKVILKANGGAER